MHRWGWEYRLPEHNEEGTRMDSHKDRLALAWQYQATKAEEKAVEYRLMAAKDELDDRPDMRRRNLAQAAHEQGVADGLRQAARQLASELVQ